MKIVNFLLKHNATVNDKDDSDRTALYLSAGRGHLAVVQALVGQGASVNMRCKDGRTALVMSPFIYTYASLPFEDSEEIEQ